LYSVEKQTKEIEMQWAPEIVKAEMDYRQEAARHSVVVERLRAARRESPSVWQRLRSRHE
jgi:hypothetical protein